MRRFEIAGMKFGRWIVLRSGFTLHKATFRKYNYETVCERH
jgi:hypothetical protein